MKITIDRREFELPDDFAVAIVAREGTLVERGGDGQQVHVLFVKKGERKGALHHQPPYDDLVVNLQGLNNETLAGRVNCSGVREDRAMFRQDPDIKPGDIIESKNWPLVYVGGRRKS